MSAPKTVTLSVDDLQKALAHAIGANPDRLTFGQRARVDTLLADLDEDDKGATFDPVMASALDPSPPPPLLLGRLDPQEHTMLYGPGGVGKGTLAASWIVQLAKAGHDVLILDYEGHDGEWARRLEGLGGQEVRDVVAYFAPLKAGAGAIWDSAEAIRNLLADQGRPYLVVDSANFATVGADPSDATTATRYWGAIQRIGAPSLTLGHVTKLHEARYSFGSAFWHNGARLTWSLMDKGEDVLLTCQKANNYRKPSAATVEVTWLGDMPREVWEKPAIIALTDRIVEALADGPLSVAAIAAMLNDGLPKGEHTSADTIRTALHREVKRGGQRVTVGEDGQWSLRDES